MSKERRKHPRRPAGRNLQIRTAGTGISYTVSLRDVSKGGAFILTTHLPTLGDTITFEILDEYGLIMTTGQGQVVRLVDTAHDATTGFAIHFDEELDQAMLDYLCAVRIEETA